MRGRILAVVVVALLVTGPASYAQTPAPTPPPVTLLAQGNAELATQRFVKLIGTELTRRGQALVNEADAAALLGGPLSAAVVDCAGDDLCHQALGQVVRATQVLIATAGISTKDATKYECVFRVVDARTGKTRGLLMVSVPATDAGLAAAANTVAEQLAPRPRLTAAVTPTPLVPVPTPVAVATPTPAPANVTIAAAEPTPTPGTAGIDTVAPPPTIRRARKPMTKDPAFWSVAGAGLLVLGVGAFFGATALQEDEPEKKGTSSVQVHF